MERARRTSVILLCGLALLAAGPAVGAAQQSAPIAVSQAAVDSAEQPEPTCFDGAGSEFTLGDENGTHVWIRLHAGTLTDSGSEFGGELIASNGGPPIIESVAGIEYVGDGLSDLLTSPLESFEWTGGFEFQLPMLETASNELGAGDAPGSDDGAANERERAGAERTGSGPFEMIQC